MVRTGRSLNSAAPTTRTRWARGHLEVYKPTYNILSHILDILADTLNRALDSTGHPTYASSPAPCEASQEGGRGPLGPCPAGSPGHCAALRAALRSGKARGVGRLPGGLDKGLAVGAKSGP